MEFLNKLTEESWKIYEESFPEDERRNLAQQKNLLNRTDYKFISIKDNDKILGLLGIWEFKNFSFIEHFAIDKNLRNKGLGSKIIKEYFNSANKLVILETELPNANDMAPRRIEFWKRTGFNLNLYDYIQPPYSKGKSPVPLYLMSYPREISEKEFKNIRKDMHAKVYGLKNPLIKID